MIRYTSSLDGTTADKLRGFFQGWQRRVSPEQHLEILAGSSEIVLAIDDETGKVVGFVTAITDRILSAYISLLEVLPGCRRQGIGTELVRRMLDKLGDLYMIDVMCDAQLQPFYQRLGMQPGVGMMIRRESA